MSDFDAVLERLVADPAFAAALAADPTRALAGYRLDPDEVALLHTQVTADAGGQHGVEVRANQSSLFGMLSPLAGLVGALPGVTELPGAAGMGQAPPVEQVGGGAGGQGGGRPGGLTGLGRAAVRGLDAASTAEGLGSGGMSHAPDAAGMTQGVAPAGLTQGSGPAGVAHGIGSHGSEHGSAQGFGPAGRAAVQGFGPAGAEGEIGGSVHSGTAAVANAARAALGGATGGGAPGSDGPTLPGAEAAVPEGYRTRVDVDGDGVWDRHLLRGRTDGGVDILVDRNRDGRVDFVGHDLDADGLVEVSEYDRDHDGFFEKRMYDDDGDGWMDRSVRIPRPSDPGH